MTNSIALDHLISGNLESAIIIMDGTELYENPIYQQSKKDYSEGSLSSKEFADIIGPLYVKLASKNGLEINYPGE